jgi:hypothetical protein
MLSALVTLNPACDAEHVIFDSMIMIMMMRSKGRNLSSMCSSTFPLRHSDLLIGLVCSALLFVLSSVMGPLCFYFWQVFCLVHDGLPPNCFLFSFALVL